jgi:hypothetical protein
MSASEKLEEEYEAVAEALVAEALEGFEKYLTPEALEITREAFLTELLCTDVGRRRLAGCLVPKQAPERPVGKRTEGDEPGGTK